MAEVRVWRGAASGRYRRPHRPATEKISAGLPIANTASEYDFGISIPFSLSSSGGQSKVHLWVSAASFPELAEAMSKASPDAAEIAFLSAIIKRRKANA